MGSSSKRFEIGIGSNDGDTTLVLPTLANQNWSTSTLLNP
jgi:hypothetical protein